MNEVVDFVKKPVNRGLRQIMFLAVTVLTIVSTAQDTAAGKVSCGWW